MGQGHEQESSMGERRWRKVARVPLRLRRAKRDVPPALGVADALVARGQLLEAIDVLAAANRERRHAGIERRLFELRYQAFDHLPDRRSAPRPWPSVEEDLFPDVAGVPEVRADQLTVERLRSAIHRHGSLIVRGLVPQSRTQSLVAEIDRLFALNDGAAPRGWAPWSLRAHTSTRLRRWNRQTGALLLVDSPSMLSDVIETFEAAGLRDLITRYFSARPALRARKCTVRRVPPDAARR